MVRGVASHRIGGRLAAAAPQNARSQNDTTRIATTRPAQRSRTPAVRRIQCYRMLIVFHSATIFVHNRKRTHDSRTHAHTHKNKAPATWPYMREHPLRTAQNVDPTKYVCKCLAGGQAVDASRGSPAAATNRSVNRNPARRPVGTCTHTHSHTHPSIIHTRRTCSSVNVVVILLLCLSLCCTCFTLRRRCVYFAPVCTHHWMCVLGTRKHRQAGTKCKFAYVCPI